MKELSEDPHVRAGQGPASDDGEGMALVASLRDAVVGVDARGRIALANERFEALFGYGRRELIGAPIAGLLPDGLPHPNGETALLPDSHEALALRHDGSRFPAEISVSPLQTSTGLLVTAVVRDVTERRQIEQELRRSKAQLAEAQALARIGSWEWDVAANHVVWSDELYRIYGLEVGEITPNYDEFLSRVHPDDRESVDARNRKAFTDHQPFEDVKRILKPDGEVFLMRTRGQVITDDEGTPVRLIGVCEDVTDSVRADEARSRLAAIVMSSDDAIVAHTTEGVITSWNPAAERLYGYTSDEAIGGRIEMLLPEGRADEELGIIEELRSGARVNHYETHRRRKNGSLVDVSLSVSPLLGPTGKLEGLSSIARDVTERRVFESRLRYLADHDALTALFNRRRFEEELAAEVAHAERYGQGGAVLVLDVDNFKYVNDTFGHGSGDDVLRNLAAICRRRTRQTDVVARLGGDEFAILLPHATEEQASVVARALIEAVRHSAVVSAGQSLRTTVSIGVALFDDEPVPADDLLAAAARAMHTAKDTGRDRCVVHAPERWQETRRRAREGWEHRIHAALDHDRLVLHCQPILDVAARRVSQYELLLRLDEDEGLVPPGAFLGVAERLGLIHEIDRWVAHEAISLLAAHAAAGRQLKFEVNLSGQSIGDRELTASIARAVQEAGIDPASLIFEITETAAIANIEEASRFARELTAAGCSFALDDFGTGFGSFYYLKHLPVDYLKIDGDFVGTPRRPPDDLIVAAIVQVAKGLGKQTIAEFVTDDDTVRRMRKLGVDYAQGYHLGRPFPVTELSARLARPDGPGG
jgi:diguanylate cyclase (GGDEF)-like protein/PAS domain S-box-containing protein